MIIIKNYQYIQELPINKLAELLIYPIEINEGDDGYDGEWQDYYATYWACPDGERCYDYDDALEHTVEWLNSEREET